MTTEIKSIHGLEPHREGEYGYYYQVGSNGVTRIEQGSFSEQPYCESWFFNVFQGETLYCTLSWAGVSQIIYKEPSDER